MPVHQITQANNTQVTPAHPPQQEQDGFTIDLMELMYRLLAGWKLILCMALCGAIVSAVYTLYFITPLFRSTAVIYVLSRDTILNVSELQLGSALTNDYIKVFDLWNVHEKVIQELDLHYSYSQIRNMLSVTNTSGTRMLDISVTSPDRDEAAQIANKYAEVVSEFIKEKMKTDPPTIMSHARPAANPFSPRKVRNIALGFVVGVLLAAAIITLRTLMDDKLKTVEDIRQYTGLITLAVVPTEDDEDETKKKTARRKS